MAPQPSAADDKSPHPNAKLEAARTAARQKPGDPHLLRAWATAALHAGDYHDAKRAVDTWILHDATPEPRVFLASVLEASGKHQEARSVLEEVLDAHPDNDAARHLHAKLGDPLPPPDTAARRTQVAKN
jgi:cytochrome c-type biogenesis protein CcmH/NrfG